MWRPPSKGVASQTLTMCKASASVTVRWPREAVGVVVGAVPDGDLLVPAEAAADPFDSVSDDGLSVAGAAEDDAALNFTSSDRFGDGADEIRVVAARIRVGA